MEKKKSWFKKHWILTGIGVFFLFIIIVGMFSPDSQNISKEATPAQKENFSEKTSNQQVLEESEISDIENPPETSKDEELKNERKTTETIIIEEDLEGIIEDDTNVNDKTSGYILGDCLDVCDEAYDIQMQVDVCQGNCYMYGKPSEAMDRYVNTIKDIIDRNN